MTITARHLHPLHTTDPVIRAYVTRSIDVALASSAGDLTDLHARIREQATAADKVAKLFANPRRARTVNAQVRRHELACATRMSSVAGEL
ncbi:hypothetical protein, partial [Aldersonia kunmingensis]|uniref:hypothetical protein n=1 Tax=Aldersonia kunmingensis TaxID=408066 RepID=UPI000B04A887